MAIITISRELAALGDETAQELAKLPGYRFVDKKALEERIKSYGIESRKFKRYDERKPSFLASLSQDRDDYIHYLKTAIFAEAEQGSCVFIGRGAGVVFKNMPGVLSIFLVAPLEIRLERVKSYFHCDEKRARQIIERSDQDRIGFHLYFFDIDWKDPGNYHLSFNTAVFTPSACAETIGRLRDYFFSPEAEARSAARLKEMVLSQQVKHHIIYERGIPIHFLETSFSGNTLTLYGVANSQALIEMALNAAREAADSAPVRSEIQIVREFNVIP
ncbi:MAG: cytidylate kinase-like family protein [Treponema sp.]|jgi:cytidylate kinase|nr:cytidylate kinase-like family protein [Treponema sp.]